MNKIAKNVFNVVWYVVVFLLIALVVQIATCWVWSYNNGQALDAVVNGLAHGGYPMLQIVSVVGSGLLTIVLFLLLRWSPFSRRFIRTRPWSVIIWTILLTIGTILPMEWAFEQLQIAMDDTTEAMFEGIMREPLGYLALGIIAPIAEEMVFRGAVLRVLLQVFDRRMHWVAIVFSALVFAVVHGNRAQGTHAFIMGLLLGWMYYRTNSIVPGMVLHWVNNSVAYFMYNLMPEANDGQLIDLFHGDERMMYLGLGFSLLIFLPSLFQLALRMRRSE